MVKLDEVNESNSSGNSGDLFLSDSQNEVAPDADPALFRDVLDSCIKVRLSNVVVNPIKKPATVEIREDT